MVSGLRREEERVGKEIRVKVRVKVSGERGGHKTTGYWVFKK